MPRDGDSNSEGMGESHPALSVAHLTKADKRRVRMECFILKSIKIRFDEEGKGTVLRLDSHEVCLYEAMFQASFWLPFLPIIRELLHHLDLAPH